MVRTVCIVLLLATTQYAGAQQAVYVHKLKVDAATRLDWMYPLLQTSPADQPARLLEGYVSQGQHYEFYGPVHADAGREYPLVLYVSPHDSRLGWQFFQLACEQHGILFAAPYDVGNGKPLARRVRATLDVLDDVRSRYRVDPERTYLAGFSGGAFVAYTIASRLPEYFGGVLVIGAVVGPPSEKWLLQRARERLSVAMLCGNRESFAAEVVSLYGPLFEALGIRTSYYAVPKLGHAMPNPRVLNRSIEWLEQDQAAREKLSGRYPAESVSEAPTRAEWAASLFAEARIRLKEKENPYAGLVQLEWIGSRWPDLPQGVEASQLLQEFTVEENEAMKAAELDERRNWERAHAIAYENFATADVKMNRKAQLTPFMAAGRSIRHWKNLLPFVEAELRPELEERIAKLEAIAAAAPEPAQATARFGGRYTIQGRTTTRKMIELLNRSLGEAGFEFVLDEVEIDEAGLDLDVELDVDAQNTPLEVLLKQILKPTKLTYRRSGNSFLIIPRDQATGLGQ